MTREPIVDRIAANQKRALRPSFSDKDLIGMIGWLDRGRSSFEEDIRTHHLRFVEFIDVLSERVGSLDATSRAKFHRTAGQYEEAAATDHVAREHHGFASYWLDRAEEHLHTARETQPIGNPAGAFYASIAEGSLARITAEQSLLLGTFAHHLIGPGALSFVKYVTRAEPYGPKIEASHVHLANARALHAQAGPEYAAYEGYLHSLGSHLERLVGSGTNDHSL